MKDIFAVVSYISHHYPFVAFFYSSGSDTDRYQEYEWILGFGDKTTTLIQDWQTFSETKKDWLTGILPYELKDRFEPTLFSTRKPEIPFPEVAFFVPMCLIYLKKGKTRISIERGSDLWKKVRKQTTYSAKLPTPPPIFESSFTQEEYIDTIRKLQSHIEEGDFYEINLTQRFLAKYQVACPFELFSKLSTHSPVPFSVYFRWEEKHLICASPERFLKQKKNTLIAQPIKGTASRGRTPEEDTKMADMLRNSEKEKAENIMIVDLMRNDLYRSCQAHSVRVPFLWEVQTFQQVHQLVSTIIGKKKKELSFAEIIRNTFPPGSMTGAPKVKVMEMIDKYEPVARGVYAGSAGFITPSGNFDFNVIIRSLVYDHTQNLLLYNVGGAITFDSIPEKEYEESLLKASAIRAIWG